MRHGGALAALAIALCAAGCASSGGVVVPARTADPPVLADDPVFGPLLGYCELLENRALYWGKHVRVVGIYRTGFEWSELYDTRCPDAARTWVEGSFEACSASERQRRAELAAKAEEGTSGSESDGATLGVVAQGVLYGGGAGYGHMNDYRFQFDVDCTERTVFLDDQSNIVDALTPKMRREIEAFLREYEPASTARGAGDPR